LIQNLSKKDILGVCDSGLFNALSKSLSNTIQKDSSILEIMRGIRFHFQKYLKQILVLGGKEGDSKDFLFKSQRGLGHAYSRAKVKFNVHKADNMVIQSIATLDQLDKDVNTLAMRTREWYSWHFPELIKIVNDNILYARLARFIGDRSTLNEGSVGALKKITEDEEQALLIIRAAKGSMGYDVAEYDLKLMKRFADRVVQLAEMRIHLSAYLKKKMYDIAPNLSVLIGEVVGARLINHAGSLTSLAKYPASTVQILGAEKALFRALKTRSATPKYGLIFNCSFITRAKAKDKGRISRYLANKCSIASRIDAFSDSSTTKFGESLCQQVEDRLKYLEGNDPNYVPEKNIDVMKRVIEALKKEGKK